MSRRDIAIMFAFYILGAALIGFLIGLGAVAVAFLLGVL